jgi:CRP-like cAMP-binding protein
VSRLLPGHHFGELSLLEPGGSAKATVRTAVDDMRLAVLKPGVFDEICRQHPELSSLIKISNAVDYEKNNFFCLLPLLQNASLGLVQQLATHAKEETIRAGHALVSVGSQSKALYFLKEGSLRMSSSGLPDTFLTQGQHCGAEAAFNESAVCDVRAEVNCTLFAVVASRLRSLCDDYPELVPMLREMAAEVQPLSGVMDSVEEGASFTRGSASADGLQLGMEQLTKMMLKVDAKLNTLFERFEAVENEVAGLRKAQSSR